MKITFAFAIILLLGYAVAHGQEAVLDHISEARKDYAAGDLENARFELENALVELDALISKAILEKMPTEWGGLVASEQDDVFSGTSLGFAGLFVDRTYRLENGSYDKNISVNLISDSPMLAGLNAFLGAPFMAGMTGRKRIKVDNYKAILEELENSETEKRYKISIPFGNALLEFEFRNMGSETEVSGLLNSFPVSEVIRLAE